MWSYDGDRRGFLRGAHAQHESRPTSVAARRQSRTPGDGDYTQSKHTTLRKYVVAETPDQTW